jgi:hypothetical protein
MDTRFREQDIDSIGTGTPVPLFHLQSMSALRHSRDIPALSRSFKWHARTPGRFQQLYWLSRRRRTRSTDLFTGGSSVKPHNIASINQGPHDRGESMATYQFRYANLSGDAIRTTFMQCAADGEAIRKARETMKNRFATLEIFDGDRPVLSKRR